MKIRYFGTVLCLAAICVIAAITGNSLSKQEKSLDDRVMEIVKGFQSENWKSRDLAFSRLIETGLGAELQGQTYRIPGALSQLFLKLPGRSDELKIALIGLLERENFLVGEHERKRGALSEEYGSYYGDLIAAVAGLKDIRALRSPLAVISTGKMATDGLAALGDEAVDPVIEKSTDLESHSGSAAAVIVLSRMLELGTIRESTSKAKIKQKLVIAIRAENWGLRMAAVRGLAKFNDPKAISLIEEVAKNDPREVPNGDGRSNGFPVKEAAQKALKSMKSALQNK